MNKYKPYLEYTSTGINWLGDIPKGWRVGGLTKFLDNIVDYRGKTPKKVDEGVFLVTARNIKDGNINYELSHEYIKIEEYETVMRRGKPKIGDVLFTTEAPLGEVANVDREDIALAQRIIKFRAMPEHLDNYYLKYWMLSHPFQSNLKTFATGSTAEGIKASKLSSLQVILPTIEEQITIVRFLNKKIPEINYLVENKYRLIDLLEQQRQSIITEAVTKGLNPNVKMKDSGVEWIGEIPEHWSILALKHIASEKKHSFVDGPFGSDLKNEEYVDSGVPVIQLNNIKNGDLRVINMNFVTKEKSEQLKRHIAYPGDLVIAKMASPIARSAVVPKTYENYVIVADCIKLKLKENYLNHYINFAMNTPFTIAQAESFANGTTRSRVNLSIIKNLKLPIPNFEEQKEIASYLTLKVSEVNNVIKAVENQIQKLKEYRQSLIYEAVTGKIDVRDMELDEVR
ncbi:restriction endonuclease subunit S [Bacillus pumilus]|uniref:restriction endonuclease subunit S n=1 Tax=Bacillus pumilus TaxID=1408 RepID=UPI0011A5D1BF|nr:restriction endonuclease subunit S [Bacillus pumilus]